MKHDNRNTYKYYMREIKSKSTKKNRYKEFIKLKKRQAGKATREHQKGRI